MKPNSPVGPNASWRIKNDETYINLYVPLIICRSNIQWLPSNKKILFFHSLGEFCLCSITYYNNLSEQ